MRCTTVRILAILALFGPLLLIVAPEALGCPFCESEIGKQVEAGIFNDDFARNVLATLLPFPILLGIVTLIHFGLPWSRGKGESLAEKETT